jgi:hypothetical protein
MFLHVQTLRHFQYNTSPHSTQDAILPDHADLAKPLYSGFTYVLKEWPILQQNNGGTLISTIDFL